VLCLGLAHLVVRSSVLENFAIATKFQQTHRLTIARGELGGLGRGQPLTLNIVNHPHLDTFAIYEPDIQALERLW
jgi:hypothetical protein